MKAILEITMPRFDCHCCPLQQYNNEEDYWYCMWTEQEVKVGSKGVMDGCPLKEVKIW